MVATVIVTEEVVVVFQYLYVCGACLEIQLKALITRER